MSVRLIQYLLVAALLLHSPALTANENEGLSRRGFLRGLITASTVAATAGPAAVLAGSQTSSGAGVILTPELRSRLVRLRLKALNTADTSAGLGNFIKNIRSLMGPHNSSVVNEKLLKKAGYARRALAHYERAGVTDFLRRLENPTQRPNLSAEARRQSTELLQHLESAPLDVRAFALRSLISPRLLQRMAWQLHFAQNSIVLSGNEVRFIQSYTLMLESFLNQSPENSLSSNLISQLLDEAQAVVSSYQQAVLHQNATCSGLMRGSN